MKLLRFIPVALVLAGCGYGTVPKNAAIPFRGQDPRTLLHYSLLDSLRSGPVFAVFVKPNDPGTDELMQYVRLIEKEYQGKAMLFTIVAGEGDDAMEYAKRTKAPGAVIPDWDLIKVKAYKFEGSPSMLLISRDSAIVQRWDGLNRADLEQLNTQLAKLLDQPPAKIDFSGCRAERYLSKGF